MLQAIVFALKYIKIIVIGSLRGSHIQTLHPIEKFTPVVLTAIPSVLKLNHTLMCINLGRLIIVFLKACLEIFKQGTHLI